MSISCAYHLIIFAKVLHPRFPSNIIRYSKVLQPYVSLDIPGPSPSTANDRSLKSRSLFGLALDEDSRDNV